METVLERNGQCRSRMAVPGFRTGFNCNSKALNTQGEIVGPLLLHDLGRTRHHPSSSKPTAMARSFQRPIPGGGGLSTGRPIPTVHPPVRRLGHGRRSGTWQVAGGDFTMPAISANLQAAAFERKYRRMARGRRGNSPARLGTPPRLCSITCGPLLGRAGFLAPSKTPQPIRLGPVSSLVSRCRPGRGSPGTAATPARAAIASPALPTRLERPLPNTTPVFARRGPQVRPRAPSRFPAPKGAPRLTFGRPIVRSVPRPMAYPAWFRLAASGADGPGAAFGGRSEGGKRLRRLNRLGRPLRNNHYAVRPGAFFPASAVPGPPRHQGRPASRLAPRGGESAPHPDRGT
jgi:hypothetical protein